MLLFSIVQIFYLIYLVGSEGVNDELKSDLKELDHLIRKLQIFSEKNHKNGTNLKELEKDLDGLDDRRRKRREMPSTSHSSLLQALQSHTGSTDQQMQQSSEETYSTHDESQALQSNEPTGSNQENFSTHDYISSTSKEQEAPYESMFEPSANFQHTSVPANDPIQPNTEENPIMKELLDENSDRNENLQESVINDISMPKKDGSPAFKIVASKVYILYPSMFQDPNIFGRFSIPQNVNMEGLGGSGEKREEITSKPVDEVLVDKGSTHEIAQEEVVVQTQRDNPVPINPALHGNPIHQQAIRPQPYQNQMYGYGQQRQMPNMYPNSYRRSGNKSTNNGRESTESGVERNWSSKGVSRRSMAKQEDESNATGGTTENKEEEEEVKKPVETHLNGHIVVQNQDVNEYNVKHSY